MLALLTTLTSAVGICLRRRRAVGELAVLSDNALKDIGLHRSHIRNVVEENLDGSLRRGRNPRVGHRAAPKAAI